VGFAILSDPVGIRLIEEDVLRACICFELSDESITFQTPP
jgi:hypothetical protein